MDFLWGATWGTKATVVAVVVILIISYMKGKGGGTKKQP